MRRVLLIVLAALVCSGLAVAYLVATDRIVVPPRWNPWAPLVLADEPNALTRYKLWRLEREPGTCLDLLRQTPFRFRSIPDRETGPGCGFRNAVVIGATDVKLSSGEITLACPTAVALALWERHSLEPAALRTFGQRVVALDHFGSYACRNLYGREAAPRSEHATANALDVAGFTLADGRRIRVVNDWSGDAPPAKFLRDVHDGACRFFSAVLGPEYNAAHRDHFHLDRGGYQVCR